MPAPKPSDVVGVVLAGGEAQRFAPLSSPFFPKALIPVVDRRALFYPLLSLARAGVTRACVVSSPESLEHINDYVKILGSDQLLTKLDVSVVAGGGDALGSADVLRDLEPADVGDGQAHLLVVTCDLVADCALAPLVEAHFDAKASCTVLLSANCPPAAAGAEENVDAGAGGKGGGKGSGKGGKGKSGKGGKEKPAKVAEEYEPELYSTVDGSGRRLLGLVDEVDLEDDLILRIRPALLQRYPDLSVRADLADPHVYMLAPWVVSDLLPALPQISSIRLELVPYLARRQFTLGREAPAEDWADRIPGGKGADVRVELCVAAFGGFVRRVNSPEWFLLTSLEVAAGALTQHLDMGDPSSLQSGPSRDVGKKSGKKAAGGGKAAKGISPFATAGERTNVSPDSFVGQNCSAGDNTSVKKSCVSRGVRLGDRVKLNGCVVLEDAIIEDGANLAACVIAAGAVVGKECVLKSCRVAPEMTVPEGTEADGNDFTGVSEAAGTSAFMDSFEFS